MPLGNNYPNASQAEVDKMVKEFGQTVVKQKNLLDSLLSDEQEKAKRQRYIDYQAVRAKIQADFDKFCLE